MKSFWSRPAWLLLVTAMLAGCSAVPLLDGPTGVDRSRWAAEPGEAGPQRELVAEPQWQHVTFPGKSPSRFSYVRKDGRHAVAVTAASSASMLRRKIRIEPAELGNVRFSWRVPQLIDGADMALRDADDSPVRVLLVFEGDRSRFSARNAMLSELARSLTGEEMPYATLMYVWCNQREAGSVITNPRTDRIRKLVVESGTGKLDRWLDYERDIATDFQRAFGEPPGALVGIGIMTDSDNTRSHAHAWYGALRLAPGRALPAPH
jgi:hypothetical protein